MNPPGPGSNNSDVDVNLQELPDKVADALFDWRKATLDREKTEAILFLQYKNGITEKRTVSEIEAMVDSNQERYDARLKEATAESEYNRLYEKLLASKKRADLRTAY